MQRRDDQWALLVRGKGHDRLIYLRGDVGAAVLRYLEQRGEVPPDERGVPLFTAVGNRAGGERLSRRGVRKIVDRYLSQLALKRPGVSNHALRHIGATLAYKYTHDLRAVQDLLGHADPRTTARYARVVDKGAHQSGGGGTDSPVMVDICGNQQPGRVAEHNEATVCAKRKHFE